MKQLRRKVSLLSSPLGSSSSRGPARNIQKSSLHKIFFSLSSISLKANSLQCAGSSFVVAPAGLFFRPCRVLCILKHTRSFVISDLWQDYFQPEWQAPKQAWVEWIIVWRPGSCRVLPRPAALNRPHPSSDGGHVFFPPPLNTLS